MMKSPLAEGILHFCNSTPISGKDVLEVGYGDGWFLREISALNPKSLTGIESSSKHRSEIPVKNAKLLEGDFLQVDFSQKFDVIFAWEVLEHLPAQQENLFFLNVKKYLNPHGQFFLSTPYEHPLSTYLDPAYWLMGHRHYTKEQVLQFASQAGLEIVRIETRGFFLGILSLYDLYISKWIFWSKPLLQRLFPRFFKTSFLQDGGHQNLFAHFRCSQQR